MAVPVEQMEVSTSSLSRILGLTPRRIQDLVAQGTIPRGSRGRFILGHAAAAYTEYLRGLRGGDGPDFRVERARLTKIRADKEALELKKLEGSLVELDDVLKEMEDLVLIVRNRLLALPTKIGPEVHGAGSLPETVALLERGVYEALVELASCGDPGKEGPMGRDARNYLYKKAADQAMREAGAVLLEKLPRQLSEALKPGMSADGAAAAWKRTVDEVFASVGSDWVIRRAQEIGDEWDREAMLASITKKERATAPEGEGE